MGFLEFHSNISEKTTYFPMKLFDMSLVAYLIF